jgi:hypothetical protein
LRLCTRPGGLDDNAAPLAQQAQIIAPQSSPSPASRQTSAPHRPTLPGSATRRTCKVLHPKTRGWGSGFPKKQPCFPYQSPPTELPLAIVLLKLADLSAGKRHHRGRAKHHDGESRIGWLPPRPASVVFSLLACRRCAIMAPWSHHVLSLHEYAAELPANTTCRSRCFTLKPSGVPGLHHKAVHCHP